jgi:transposase-like protein
VVAKKKKHPGGRPTVYKPDYARQAQYVIEDSGFSMYKLAKLFDVARRQIYHWMEKHEEFRHGIETGRTVFDGTKIHKSLVRRATGFAFTETTREPDKEGKLKIVRTVKKHLAPDITSIKHWQSNRDPANWSDKQELDINQKTEIEMSDEDRKIAKSFSANFAKAEFKKLKKA